MKTLHDISAPAPSRIQFFVRFVQAMTSWRPRNGSWNKEMRSVIGDLEKLNSTTEADFLAIGGNLMAFLTASRQLHANIGELSALVSGDNARRACAALVSVRGLAREMQERSGRDRAAFANLHTSAKSIHGRFSTFGKMALSFQITAILARIETAHLALSQKDLGNLADEVSSCGDGIQDRAVKVLEAAAAFNTRIASSSREVSRLEAIQEKELPALLAAVDADLEVFESRQRDAAQASLRLGADLNSVAQDLGTIATAIQFHDITRQQVEHVIEALTVLLKDPTLSAAAATRAQVQKAQLQSATSAFCRSTAQIHQDLDAIAGRVSDMAVASKCILGLDRDAENSFLSDMLHRFEAVFTAVSELLSLEKAARYITGELDQLSSALRASVNEVQTIELQLSRISINAAISASHIGAPGDPLNVVAESMQTLQKECASRSRDAESDLDSIGEAILSLAEPSGGEAANVSRAEVLDNLGSRLRDLRSESASSLDSASGIASLADTLCKNLQTARDQLGVGGLFAQTMEHCVATLDGIIAKPQSSWPFGTPALETENDKLYTMQAERDIHNAVINGSTQPAETPPAESGEEVEFF